MPPAHHHHQDIAALQDRLTRLSQASLNNNESLDLDDVFRQVLDSARSLTGAHYGVITTINDAGHNNAFLSSGTTPEEHRRLAEMPERHQLFGYLVNDGLEMSHFYGLKLNHLVFAQSA